MKLMLSTLFLLALVGCDAPQRTRNGIYDTVSGNGLQQSGGSTGSSGGNDWNWNNGGSSGSSSGGSTNLGQGFENCDLSTSKGYAYDIGHVGICKSSVDETIVKAKTGQSNTTTKVCIIPTYKEQSGSSTYIGQPQCYFPQANVVTQGKLYKNRLGTFGNGVPFSNLPLNGVMMMKETSLNAYFECMNAIGKFTHPDCPYGSNTAPYYKNGQMVNCMAMAIIVRDQKCNDFKVTQPYLDLAL